MSAPHVDTPPARDARRGSGLPPEEAGTRMRHRIIGVLVVVGIVLFVAGKYGTVIRPTLDLLSSTRDSHVLQKMHEDFFAMLEEYGIDRGWVDRQQIHVQDSSYVRDEWTITVPRNMPLASLSNDIRQYAIANGGTTYSFENTKTAQLFVHLTVRGRVFMTFIFTSSSTLEREGGDIAILVDGIEKASKSEIDALAASKDPIACLIAPDRDVLQSYDKLQAAGKEMVLLLHFSPGRQSANRFSLSDDMKEGELLSRARNIIKNFPGARFHIITSERLQGNNAAVVAAEMAKNGLVAIESSSLTYLDRDGGEEEIITRINDLSALAMRNTRAWGVAELRDGAVEFLADQMARLRKRGFVFRTLRQMQPKPVEAEAETGQQITQPPAAAQKKAVPSTRPAATTSPTPPTRSAVQKKAAPSTRPAATKSTVPSARPAARKAPATKPPAATKQPTGRRPGGTK